MEYEEEELLAITAELAWKYTSGESTSLSWEKAQMLMEAVLYCLEEYKNAEPTLPACRALPLKEQYEAGRRLVYEKVNRIREDFNSLAPGFRDYGVRCLYDTVQKGIPEFLKWYDVKYCPQDTILTLDYPLITDISSLRGADAVYVYLRKIRTEQDFLRIFPEGYVERILQAYDFEYSDMVENICEIIWMNTIGHIVIQKPLEELGFQKEEYGQLSRIFGGASKREIADLIRGMIKGITERFFSSEMDVQEYLSGASENMAVRIGTAWETGGLDRIFYL